MPEPKPMYGLCSGTQIGDGCIYSQQCSVSEPHFCRARDPSRSSMLRFFCVLFALFLRIGVFGLQNISVDDTSPMILYSSGWQPASQHTSPLNFGGAHTLTVDKNATATFTFTGVAVYYLASLWPNAVSSLLSLDGGPQIYVYMATTDNRAASSGLEVVQSAPLWGAAGLANTQHTLVVSVAPDTGFGIVDGFIYTADGSPADPAPSPASPAPPSRSLVSSPSLAAGSASSTSTVSPISVILIPSAASSTSQPLGTGSTPPSESSAASEQTRINSNQKSMRKVVIALVTCLVFFALMIGVLGFWLWRRHRRQQAALNPGRPRFPPSLHLQIAESQVWPAARLETPSNIFTAVPFLSSGSGSPSPREKGSADSPRRYLVRSTLSQTPDSASPGILHRSPMDSPAVQPDEAPVLPPPPVYSES